MSEPLGLGGPHPTTADEATCWDCLGDGKSWLDRNKTDDPRPCETCNGRGSIPKRHAP